MRKMRSALAAIIALTLSAHAPPAAAAPFCVEVQGIPDECWYYDISLCRQEAVKKKGYCTASREGVVLPESAEEFCMVDSSLVPVCIFQNGEDCRENASRINAVCFESGKTKDLHRFDRAPYRGGDAASINKKRG